MNIKKIITIVSFLLVILIVIILINNKTSINNVWVCTNNGWILRGESNVPKPTTPCNEIEKREIVEKYIRENISNLSVKKEVLGGKFYVNKIEWINKNSGIVEYEDGHILLTASFDYKIESNIHTKQYSLIIENFSIIK